MQTLQTFFPVLSVTPYIKASIKVRNETQRYQLMVVLDSAIFAATAIWIWITSLGRRSSQSLAGLRGSEDKPRFPSDV